ncbi:multiheme c-type cytochrome [Roseibium sp.]|uniref:multiheme c-type cytochrome n=1 Tax=Roseibium sp. TaxID=1936156 RepID=UPI003A97739F
MTSLIRLAAMFLAVACGSAAAQNQSIRVPAYVGSDTCGGCHEAEMASWLTSHHAKAWMEPGAETVDGDFNDAQFTHKGRTTRFFQKDGGYFIETMDAPDGPKTYEVLGVGGVAPLQQYLIETEPGRLQSLDIVWDQEKSRWYHLYPDQLLPPDDGYHWTGPYKNWNGRCAECHATGFRKNYELATRQYESTQAEIGVGCEACHGPGQAHVTWAEDQATYAKSPFPGTTEAGFLLTFSKGLPETEIQQCAGCHARRSPLQDGNPLPGTPFHDSYRLALLSEQLYHADGQIKDEVYVYGSFLQSKMYEKGVRCSNCHDPHDAGLKAEGNAICTQCHSPAGNPNFPSLAAKTYDDSAHHFHPVGSDGAQCVSCHMIERTYMGIDGRRDHSFRVPRPDLSAKVGTPDACTDCHSDRTPAWAAAELEKRFPDSRHRGAHFSEVFHAARTDQVTFADELLAIAEQASMPAIVRASALDHLRPRANAGHAKKAAELLKDKEPLVRAAAVALQSAAPDNVRLEAATSLLDDPVKSVRIAAARQLLGLPLGRLPEARSRLVRSAFGEWQSSLAATADFPETHLALGGSALAMRNTRAAVRAFQEVTNLDPQLVDAWVMLVRIHLAERNWAKAEFNLQKAIAANPDNPALLDLKQQFPDAK